MGSSKIIMLSGVYLILGFYTLSFNRVDEANFSTANSTASQMQAEQLARTGLSFALTYMADNSSINSFATRTFSTSNGGTITYSADRPSSFPLTQSQIVAVGTFNGKQVTMTAVFHYYGGRWKIARIHTATV